MFHKSYKGETRKQKVTSVQGEGARVVFSGITVEMAVTSAQLSGEILVFLFLCR